MSAACQACGGADFRPKLETHGVAIRACSECGLAFWNADEGFRPESVYDATYFGDSKVGHGYDDYGELEEVLRHNFARRIAKLPRPAGGRLLDVGAAYGYAVDEAARAGWKATGLEVSRAAASRATSIAPGRILVANGLQLPFADASFEALTLWDVIEHLADPADAIAEAARVLRPGGRIALTTGDVGSLVARLSGPRWHLYTLPEHLFFFSRESLRRLLDAHGLRVVSMRAESSSYTLGYLVERLRKSLLGRSVERSGRWPGSQLPIPVNLFDIVTVHAVRG